MGSSTILSVIHTVTIGIMLNNMVGGNDGHKDPQSRLRAVGDPVVGANSKGWGANLLFGQFSPKTA